MPHAPPKATSARGMRQTPSTQLVPGSQWAASSHTSPACAMESPLQTDATQAELGSHSSRGRRSALHGSPTWSRGTQAASLQWRSLRQSESPLTVMHASPSGLPQLTHVPSWQLLPYSQMAVWPQVPPLGCLSTQTPQVASISLPQIPVAHCASMSQARPVASVPTTCGKSSSAEKIDEPSHTPPSPLATTPSCALRHSRGSAAHDEPLIFWAHASKAWEATLIPGKAARRAQRVTRSSSTESSRTGPAHLSDQTT